jgi:hypothetical protein
MRASESLTETELDFSEPSENALAPFYGDPTEGSVLPRVETTLSAGLSGGTPWWLWWNILSLDAPTVALIWAVVFARVGGIQLRIASEIVLALAVFLIYAVDRLLDGWTATRDGDLQERHLFCARHRRSFVVSAILAATGIIFLAASRLPMAETRAGVGLASIVAVYILAIQAWRGLAKRLPSKEWAVGILFAAGTTLPVWSRAGKLGGAIWVLVILFGLLCSLNCLLIDSWESETAKPSLLPRGRRAIGAKQRWNRLPVSAMPAVLGLVAIVFSWSVRTHIAQAQAACAIAFGAFLLLLLNEQRPRLSRSALRVLADGALVVAGLLAIFLGS